MDRRVIGTFTWKRVAIWVVAAAVPLGVGPGHSALAQSQPSAASSAPGPDLPKVFRIDIAAKPLPQAIADLSTQTGLQVL